MTISVVVPCFNEEESIPLFYREMERVRMKMGEKFEYIFINDGSSDGTLSVLRKLHVTDSSVHYLSFSRNFGKEAALYAGLERTSGEYVTVMDVDLQDPPELLIEMKQRLEEQPDLDCVGTRRVTRDGEPPIRSFFARMFYKLINHISQVEMVDGARDFRLMRRPMVDAIMELSEYNRFSKGIFAWVGFETEYLEYKNVERVAGETSWNFWSLFKHCLYWWTVILDFGLYHDDFDCNPHLGLWGSYFRLAIPHDSDSFPGRVPIIDHRDFREIYW